MLTSDELQRLHAAGLSVLERTGVGFKHDETVALFASHGFAVEGTRVRMTPERVAGALATVPDSFVLEAWNPTRSLVFGGDALVVATGAGPASTLEGGVVRPSTDADLLKSIRVAHVLPNLDMIGFPLEPQDIPASARYVRPVTCALAESDKPLEYALSTAEHVRVLVDTSEIVFGSAWDERPRAFSVLNTISPLQYEEGTCVAILEMAGRNQPICITPCAMGGTTGPATVAGVLVQQHAETLAGLVLAQLVRPGCPVVYGGLSSMASMVTGDPLFGIPEFWAAMVATTELGRSLGLPVRAGAALTDAHALDLQAGIESALGLATVIQAGVNFILHGAGIVSALNAISFEKLLVDDETVGMLRTLRAGIRVDDEALALDVIDRVGPGGNFLLEEHTAAHCRDALRPSFFNRRKYGAWAERGGRDAVEEAACRVGAALDAFAPPHVDTVIRRQLEEYALRYC